MPHPAFDLRDQTGPFDIIGDVHGCADELRLLLEQLGYSVAANALAAGGDVTITPPAGRRLIFVGDFVDRGPRSPAVLRMAMRLCATGAALAVAGNHDVRFVRLLKGLSTTLTHGLAETKAQMEHEPEPFHADVRDFLEALPYYLWLDEGKLLVAHAGIRADMIGFQSGAVRSFCLYGETAGVTADDGLPVRYNWAARYAGDPFVVYGHTPVAAAAWQNNTVCIDTGCCYGNQLTALRWPEREIVSVPAVRAHAILRRPLGLPPDRPDGH